MKPSGADMDAMITGKALYEKFRRGEPLDATEAERLIPTREDFASVFRALRSQNGWKGSPEMFLPGLPGTVPGMEKFLVALDVFAEKGLIHLNRIADTYEVRMTSQGGKVNLEDAPTLGSLRYYEKAGEQNGMAAENI
jgi:single-stranded-DNA-specific exonuclease